MSLGLTHLKTLILSQLHMFDLHISHDLTIVIVKIRSSADADKPARRVNLEVMQSRSSNTVPLVS